MIVADIYWAPTHYVSGTVLSASHLWAETEVDERSGVGEEVPLAPGFACGWFQGKISHTEESSKDN